MPDQDNSPVWVKWEKKFELGIPAIDEQHRHLVGLCNQLHSETMSRRSPDGKAWRVALSEALRETVSYTRTHFHLEEKLMAAARLRKSAGTQKLPLAEELGNDLLYRGGNAPFPLPFR